MIIFLWNYRNNEIIGFYDRKAIKVARIKHRGVNQTRGNFCCQS